MRTCEAFTTIRMPGPSWARAWMTMADLGLAFTAALDISVACELPAVVVMRFGCVHEHIYDQSFCERHERRPDDRFYCTTCLQAGHLCTMLAQVVERL